jgi:hypothetical protein
MRWVVKSYRITKALERFIEDCESDEELHRKRLAELQGKRDRRSLALVRFHTRELELAKSCRLVAAEDHRLCVSRIAETANRN